MMIKTGTAILLTLSLGACGGMGVNAEVPTTMPSRECKADSVQALIGETATGELGARLLRETGARTLRWVPPRTAVTMDYRADRLTVGYDDDYKITSISCG